MKPSEIRELSTQELITKLSDAREELMNLRFQMAIGGQTDTSRLRITRRTIARMETILAEREIMPQGESKS